MNDASSVAEASPTPPCSYSLWQLVRYMLALGTWGFGGPVALVGYMYRDLVEKRQWISESDYKEGMALAQLMPGPLAAQLAIYLGYVNYRVRGATLVGLAFVLPSFAMVVAIGAVYSAHGGIGWMQAVFYGVGAAVIGIIAMSAYKLTAKASTRQSVALILNDRPCPKQRVREGLVRRRPVVPAGHAFVPVGFLRHVG